MAENEGIIVTTVEFRILDNLNILPFKLPGV